jgi:hypothetical protein
MRRRNVAGGERRTCVAPYHLFCDQGGESTPRVEDLGLFVLDAKDRARQVFPRRRRDLEQAFPSQRSEHLAMCGVGLFDG